jgi:uncharacterized membrane protein
MPTIWLFLEKGIYSRVGTFACPGTLVQGIIYIVQRTQMYAIMFVCGFVDCTIKPSQVPAANILSWSSK